MHYLNFQFVEAMESFQWSVMEILDMSLSTAAWITRRIKTTHFWYVISGAFQLNIV